MSAYTRENPSPEYRATLAMYATLHETGADKSQKPDRHAPAKTFAGKMLVEHAATIKTMIVRTGSRSLLDYGSGKGQAYEEKDIEIVGAIVPSLKAYWGIENVRCFDPGYEPFGQLPKTPFDGVISTDVLEHIHEPDLPWVLDEIFGFARSFVFANIACYPAKKKLPDGQNAHCTVRSPDWWTGLIHAVAMRHTEISYHFCLTTRTGSKKHLNLVGERGLRHHTRERWVQADSGA